MKGRILLVDDDLGARLSLGALLEDEGYEVLEASNLHEARELLNKEPDLVLLDLHLGDVQGTELLNSIPATARVVVMSGAAPDTELTGIHAWLVKGADTRANLDAIASAIQCAQAAGKASRLATTHSASQS